MKKIQAFAIVAVIALIATSSVFAQTANTVQKMTGVKGIALRTYCSFSTLFRAQNAKCFDANKASGTNTASIGAIDAGTGSVPNTPTPAPTPTPTPAPQSVTIGGFSVPTAPQVIERTVIVQGTPGPQGPAGQAGANAFGSFTNVPQVFWNGGGGSGSSGSTITNVIAGAPLPVGGLPGQVLTLDASSSPTWAFPLVSTSSLITLGSLENFFATNGLNLATTSTSTTIKLGGLLTENTIIGQSGYNFTLGQGNFKFLSQGTTSIPLSFGTTTQFMGLQGSFGTESVYAGLIKRVPGPNMPYEIFATDTATGDNATLSIYGKSTSDGAVAQLTSSKGNNSSSVRVDGKGLKLTASSTQVRVNESDGVKFSFGANSYIFPKADGLTNEILTSNGLGQLSFRSLAAIIASSSTSTIPTTGWSLSGNSGTNSTTNFIGTTDAQPLVIKTNATERARFAANGNFSLFTNDFNASSSITVKGIHADGRWGIFDDANNKLIQNRSDVGILGLGTGDFVSYGFNSAMGIRGADVMIPHLVVGGNIIGPNNISQLRMESSSQNEYDYAGAYPSRANTYKISTNLSAPLPGAIRAPIAFGGRELNFFSGADDTGTPELTIAENGNVGIGTTTPARPLTVVGNVGGSLGMFQNTRAGAPSGVSFLATRADTTTSNRFGWFVNPNVSGEDRLGVHSSGTGDLWSFSQNGDLVGSLGTSFNQRADATPARLSVMANDARPVAYFQNGPQTYARFANSPSAFSQSYDVGVESAGGTFNIIDTNAAQTRMTINSSGNVGIGTILPSTRLEVNSGNANDSGFAFSQLNAATPALGTQLKFLTVNALGKVILSGLDTSVFATSSPAGVNGSVQFKKDGLFASNVNFNWDDMNSRLGLGTNAPTEKLEVAGNIKIRTNDKIIFENNTNSDWITSGPTRDMTRPGRSLQFWTASNVHMQINDSGDFAWNSNGSGDRTFEVRPSNGQTSNVLVMRQNPNQGAASLFSVNGLGGGYFAGSVGIGTTTPRAKLDVAGDAWIGQVKISNSLAGFPSPTNAIEFWHGDNPGTGNNGTGIVAGGQTNGTKLLLTSANMDGSGQFDHHQLGRIFIPGYGQGISFRAAGGMASTSNAFQWTVGDINPAVSTQYERMVLNQGGFLGLGTSAPARKLHVAIAGSGQVARFQNGDGTCNINPSIFLAFNCLSDRNLKKDIVTLTPSLAQFSLLNPVNYHWNTEDSASPLQYGFIAQEIEAIFPSFVTTDSETGIKSVAFGNLIPVTIKAIQEMNIALGDLSKDVNADTFADSVIYKRFADAFRALTVAFKNITADKATVKELCLPKSDGTVICLSGDQVAAIAASASVSLEPVKEVVIVPTPVVPPPAPVEVIPAALPQSESPGNPVPEVVLQSESVLPTVEVAPAITQ